MPDLPPSTPGTPSAETVLGRQHRWMRAGLPLMIINAGLLLTLALLWKFHPSGQRIEKWGRVPIWWVVGVAVPVLIATALWAIRRRSVAHAARSLDERLAAMNRLETAISLKDADDAVARAQREETAKFLSHTRVPSRAGLTRSLGLVLGVALLAHLFTLGLWSRPWEHAAATPAPVAKTQPPPGVPRASITWKSPDAETKAVPIEEVPYEAAADSETGLRDLTLDISVNGQPALSVPVPVDSLGKPGKHSIQASMYLDQLSVEPYDMVSYYLHAKRVASEKYPEAVSAVQFVEVKPFRDDVREVPGGDGKSLFPYITALKVAQLRLMKENFVLAHAEISNENPAWVKENQRVGDDQGLLREKAGEVIQKLTEGGIPAPIIDLLTQAQGLMGDAAKKIGVKQNTPALPAQGKSLGLITEIEKYFVKEMAKDGHSKPGPKVEDPFKKQQEVELKQRFQTQAGELELLAKEQQRLAEDLTKQQPASGAGQQPAPAASPSATPGKEDKNRIDGTLPERQTQISQRVVALLTGQTFVPEVTEHLENGRTQARESLRQLDADDIPKAREPAASAARELRLAAEAMDRAGEEKAKDALADALRAMNQAASQAAGAPKEKSDQDAQAAAKGAADKVGQARVNLAKAAKKQQETGSEKAAQRLAAAAKALNDARLHDAMQKLYNQPRDAAQAQTVSKTLSQLADQLGGQQPGGKKSPDQIAALIERLERSRANMMRLAAAQEAGAKAGGSGTPSEKGEATPSSGKSPGKEGQKPGAAPGSSPGSAPGSSPGAAPGSSPGMGSGSAPELSVGLSPGSSPGSAPGTAPGSATGTSPGKPGETPGPKESQPGENGPPGDNPAAAGNGGAPQERYARELMEDLQQEMQESSSIVPPGGGVEVVRSAISGPYSDDHGSFAQCVAAFKEIEAPLDAVITSLKAELAKSERQHELLDQSAEYALPAYREAVADYFEQLSRDYQTAPVGTPPDGKKGGAQ